jgi:hypothetical protein
MSDSTQIIINFINDHGYRAFFGTIIFTCFWGSMIVSLLSVIFILSVGIKKVWWE